MALLAADAFQFRCSASPKNPLRALWHPFSIAQALEQHGRQSDIARYAAFAFADVDHHSRAVDIANLKMKQPVDAEGGGVQRGKDGPVQEVGSPVQEVGDDGRVDEIRQSRDSLGAGDLVVEPTLLESVDIKK